jgi:hypothetical protein
MRSVTPFAIYNWNYHVKVDKMGRAWSMHNGREGGEMRKARRNRSLGRPRNWWKNNCVTYIRSAMKQLLSKQLYTTC